MVCWTVAYLEACYQMALRINSCLLIMTDTKAFVGFLIRSSSLLRVRLLSLAFTALNLLPSIEMYDLEKSFCHMQNLLNSLKTLVIAFLSSTKTWDEKSLVDRLSCLLSALEFQIFSGSCTVCNGTLTIESEATFS